MISVGGSELTQAFVTALLMCSCTHDFDRFDLSDDRPDEPADDAGLVTPDDAGDDVVADDDASNHELPPGDSAVDSDADAGPVEHDGGATLADSGTPSAVDARTPTACQDVTLACGGERTACQSMCVSSQEACVAACDRMKCVRDCELVGQDCDSECTAACVDCFSREGCAPVCPG